MRRKVDEAVIENPCPEHRIFNCNCEAGREQRLRLNADMPAAIQPPPTPPQEIKAERKDGKFYLRADLEGQPLSPPAAIAYQGQLWFFAGRLGSVHEGIPREPGTGYYYQTGQDINVAQYVSSSWLLERDRLRRGNMFGRPSEAVVNQVLASSPFSYIWATYDGDVVEISE